MFKGLQRNKKKVEKSNSKESVNNQDVSENRESSEPDAEKPVSKKQEKFKNPFKRGIKAEKNVNSSAKDKNNAEAESKKDKKDAEEESKNEDSLENKSPEIKESHSSKNDLDDKPVPNTVEQEEVNESAQVEEENEGSLASDEEYVTESDEELTNEKTEENNLKADQESKPGSSNEGKLVEGTTTVKQYIEEDSEYETDTEEKKEPSNKAAKTEISQTKAVKEVVEDSGDEYTDDDDDYTYGSEDDELNDEPNGEPNNETNDEPNGETTTPVAAASDLDNTQPHIMRQYQAMSDFTAEQPSDLSFNEGEIITLLEERENGWYLAKNSQDEQGVVPINFLQVYNQFTDVDQESEPETPGAKSPRSGRLLWDNIKNAVNETSVTDVLHAMGAVPSGFRESTVAKFASNSQNSTAFYLSPKLSSSCVSYNDLFFDSNQKKLQLQQARIQRIVTIVSARQIPSPGAGVLVRSRHVRICLFDGKNCLSNTHVIQVANTEKDHSTWNFNIKVSDIMKSVTFSEVFIRSNSTNSNIGILFELGLTYVREKTGQEGEFSCGWVFLPLFDASSVPIQNKTYDQFVNGGTPFEKGVVVDPSVGRRASTSRLRNLVAGSKQPRLLLRIAIPTKDQKDLLDTLPNVFIGCTAYLFYVSMYRQILCDALLRDCSDPQSTDNIHSPLLTSFPLTLENTDLMDLLRFSWAEKFKVIKRVEKKSTESMKAIFQQLYMNIIYPFCHVTTLKPYVFGNNEIEKARHEELQRINTIRKKNSLDFAVLLSPDIQYSPFSVSETSFNVINNVCYK